MFKIGDFSRLAQVSVRMLRHYDKLGLLTPSYTDKFTGYRYYTIDQLARLNRILALNGLGLTLQEIGDLLGDGNEVPVDQLRGMLVLRRKELERELADKRWQLASVEARLQQIEQENDPDPYEVIVKSLEPLPVASIRLVSPTVQEVGYYCNTIYGQLYRRLREHDIEPVAPEVTFYHNEEYTDTDIDMEVATAIDDAVLDGAPVDDALIFRAVPGCDLAAALIFEGGVRGCGGTDSIPVTLDRAAQARTRRPPARGAPFRPGPRKRGAGRHQCNRATGSHRAHLFPIVRPPHARASCRFPKSGQNSLLTLTLCQGVRCSCDWRQGPAARFRALSAGLPDRQSPRKSRKSHRL